VGQVEPPLSRYRRQLPGTLLYRRGRLASLLDARQAWAALRTAAILT
jgi:hypothetical protein